jgi:hypothetical protein
MLDDRLCKVCQQYKPLFEFRSNGNRYSFTCLECEETDKPVQPAEFADKFVKSDTAPLLTTPILPAAFMDGQDEDELKVCHKCGDSFAATEEFFYRQRGSLVSPCKACQAEQRQRSQADKPCPKPGCPNPREIAASGRVQTYCSEHRAEEQRRYHEKHKTQKTVKMCPIDGCDQPRCFSSTGRLQSYCTEHQREAQKRHDDKRADQRKAQRTDQRQLKPQPSPQARRTNLTVNDGMKPCKLCRRRLPNTPEHFAPFGRGLSTTCIKCQAQPVERGTAAQRDSGWVNQPGSIKGREIIKILVVDHITDEMIFVDGTVTLRTKTHADHLLPGGFDLLLDCHAEQDGYKIYERGSLGIASRYAGRD